MGRKKKVVEAPKTEEQKLEEAKPEERKEDVVTLKQMPLVAPDLPTGEIKATVIPMFPEPEKPVSLDWLRDEGKKWAEECGLRPPFMLTGPDRVDYPRYGYGYSMTVKEETGKGRLGTARFNQFGERSYWSIDGIVTG